MHAQNARYSTLLDLSTSLFKTWLRGQCSALSFLLQINDDCALTHLCFIIIGRCPGRPRCSLLYCWEFETTRVRVCASTYAVTLYCTRLTYVTITF